MVLENGWLRNHDRRVTCPISAAIPMGVVNSGQVSKEDDDKCYEEDEMQ